MAAFKKMAIVPSDELDRIKQRQLTNYNPELRIMSWLQNEIDDIFSRSDIAPIDRLALIQTAMHRFQSFNIKNITQLRETPQINQPGRNSRLTTAPPAPAAPEIVTSTPAAPVPSPVPAPQRHQSMLESDILDPISIRFKERADAVLDHLSQFPEEITLDKKGELILQGEPVKGTTITD